MCGVQLTDKHLFIVLSKCSDMGRNWVHGGLINIMKQTYDMGTYQVTMMAGGKTSKNTKARGKPNINVK